MDAAIEALRAQDGFCYQAMAVALRRTLA